MLHRHRQPDSFEVGEDYVGRPDAFWLGVLIVRTLSAGSDDHFFGSLFESVNTAIYLNKPKTDIYRELKWKQ